MTSITIEELRLFHSIDRTIFARLVMNLRRDSGQSMLAISLWLWLEEVGFPNIILKMLSLPDQIVGVVADEAAVIMSFLESSSSGKHDLISLPSHKLIQMTRSLMNSSLSFEFLHEQRLSALNGVCKNVQKVCIKAFDDILQIYLLTNSTTQGGSSSSSGSTSTNTGFHQLAAAFNRTDLMGNGSLSSSSSHNHRQMAHPIWGPTEDHNIVPQDERTMFMTFSRGYPLSETEVRDFLARNYGDCVEAFYMEEVPENQQPLYARVIFRSSVTITAILDGKQSAQFVINGKHVRTRRWILYGRS